MGYGGEGRGQGSVGGRRREGDTGEESMARLHTELLGDGSVFLFVFAIYIFTFCSPFAAPYLFLGES